VYKRQAIACALSFVLGMGLYGMVYLMPVFLGLVRDHGPLGIGEIMLVTGVAQLIFAPLAVQLDQKTDARLLTGFGFVLLALGMGMSAFQTRLTDYDEMFWPQVVRGAAIMFCLLPPTRIALGQLTPGDVPDGSALFNLMRNLGGAIGIAMIDTLIWHRTPIVANDLGAKIMAGDTGTANAVGVPAAALAQGGGGAPGAEVMAALKPLVEKAALTTAVNEAWAMVALATLLAVVLLPFVKRTDAVKAARPAPAHAH
jgi:DHA2 family multidrug resistance protein